MQNGKESNIMKKDVVSACIISLLAPIIALLIGDYLYIGMWYYFLFPFLIIITNYLCKSKEFICSGMAVALQISYLGFFYWQHHVNEGLLGLLHLCFLLPGAAIGCVIALVLTYKKSSLTNFNRFMYGFFGFATGAFLGMGIYFSNAIF